MKARNVINNSSYLELLLEFEAAFPKEKRLEPETYLIGGSRNIILKVATFFLGFKNRNSKYQDNKVLLESIFSKENNDFSNELYTNIQKLEKKGDKVKIINPDSSLRLFEIFFHTEEEKETQTSTEFEINLFKAYLTLNSIFTQKQKVAFDSTKDLETELHFPLLTFCMSYPYSDKLNYNISEIWTTQIIKAIFLFRFLEHDSRSKALLSSFLDYFECKTWEDYLKKILPLTTSAIKNENEAQTDIIVTPGNNFNGDCAFLDKLILVENDEFNQNDFITLRAKPFYKISNGTYRIIFSLFVVEKVFKGLYFILRDVNNKLTAPNKITDLKSFFGDEFSEKIMLYEILNKIYPNKCISFTGKQLSDLKVDGAPDYYIRVGNDILIFESKDFLIPASSKESFDYHIYEDEFEKKLYFEEKDGREKHKAVMQLIGVVKKILQSEIPCDRSYKYRSVSIYPIIITHDPQYDVSGLNNLVDYWFQSELEILKEEGLFINRVKPLVLINIDSLIYHQVALLNNFKLHEIIQKYFEHIHIAHGLRFPSQEEAEKYILGRTIPFAIFLDNFLAQKKLKNVPPMLEEMGYSIFKSDS